MRLVRSMAFGALALLTIGAKRPPELAHVTDGERVINVAAGELVTANVNGHPMKMRVDFDAWSSTFLNPASAAHAGLKGSKTTQQVFGPVRVKGQASLNRLTIGGVEQKVPIIWFERNAIEGGADGIIGPGGLPENKVTLSFHPPVRGERTIELPVDYHGNILFRETPIYRSGVLTAHVRLGGNIMWIKLAPDMPVSLITAAAGAQLAAMQDGHWTGETRPVLIRLGVERPGRPMTLRRPIDLGGLPIRGFMVRTSDFKGDYRLPSDTSPKPEEQADPNEIVVTGTKLKSYPQFGLILGQDALGGCSSITHDKRRKMMILHCI